jgi:hypothetical protein
VTKTELMALVATGRVQEAFTHTIYGTFNITQMRKATADGIAERVMVPLYEINPFIRVQRVTEPSRIADLTVEQWRDDPGLGFDTPDGFVMLDGHHRALRREMEGMTHMHLWRFPYELMSSFFPAPGYIKPAEFDKRFDWGDPIVNGKIIRGGSHG